MKHSSLPTDSAVQIYPSSLRAGYCVLLLVLACLFAYVDVQVFALRVDPIKVAFGLSDARIGVLQGIGIDLTTALAAIPIGILVDRNHRIRLILFAMLSWSLFTAMCGLSTGYWPLLLCRIGVGISQGGLYPAAYSLIADLYPSSKRARAMLIFFGGILLSASAALAVGGALIGFIDTHARTLPGIFATMAPWRLSFIAVAVPSAAVALLFLTLSEPTRKQLGDVLAPATQEPSIVPYLRGNWRTIACLNGGQILSYAAFAILLFWLPTILMRRFDLPPSKAGQLFGVTLGLGTLSGVFVASALSRWLKGRHGELAPLQVFKAGVWAVTFFLPLLLLTESSTQLLIAWVILAAFTYTASSIAPILWMAITPNHLRGRLAAINQLATSMIGPTLLPIVGRLSDGVFRGSNGLLEATCAVAIPCSLIAPLLLIHSKGPVARMARSELMIPAPAVN